MIRREAIALLMRLCVSMTGGVVWEEHSTGGRQKYQGPHVASRGRGRKTETGARGDAIIIDAAVYVGVRGGPQAGRTGWAGLGGAKGGQADVTHAN